MKNQTNSRIREQKYRVSVYFTKRENATSFLQMLRNSGFTAECKLIPDNLSESLADMSAELKRGRENGRE